MQNHVLRIFMWILGVSALVGNIFVVIWRFTEKTSSATQTVQAVTIGNLAVSDFIMGVYMIILAGADLYYGEQYFVYSDEWRSGVVCKFAGFLALLSSEASVFFITLISIDRFLCVTMPFSQIRLGPLSCKIAAGVVWIVTLLIALIPTLYADPDSDIYDLSDVCIGLPLITRPAAFQIEQGDIGNPVSSQSFSLPVVQESKPAWYFSIVLFLGVNSACFLTICVCYTIMFFKVQSSRKNIQRTQKGDEDIKMALKMAVIVATDFLCWMPVIIMGILSQTGLVVIPLQMYTWSVVFIIPINSSLNPYLYTISHLSSKTQTTKKTTAATWKNSSTTKGKASTQQKL